MFGSGDRPTTSKTDAPKSPTEPTSPIEGPDATEVPRSFEHTDRVSAAVRYEFGDDSRTRQSYDAYVRNRPKDEKPTENWTDNPSTKTRGPDEKVLVHRIGISHWTLVPMVATGVVWGALNVYANRQAVRETFFKPKDVTPEVEAHTVVKEVPHEVPAFKKEVESPFIPDRLRHDAVDAQTIDDAERQVIKAFVDDFASKLKDGVKLDGKFYVHGLSSDEMGSVDDSLCLPDTLNQEIGGERGTKWELVVREMFVANGLDPELVSSDGAEAMLVGAECDDVQEIKAQLGFETDANLIAAYRGGKLDPEIAGILKMLLDDKRGIRMNYRLDVPAGTTTEIIKETTFIPAVPEVVVTKPGKGFDLVWYHLWKYPAPVLPPLPVPEIYPALVRRRGKVETHTPMPSFKPPVDPVHSIAVLREALEPDGVTLRQDPWAATRKYAVLLREDRVEAVTVVSLDIPHTDKQKEIRILSVDHLPSNRETRKLVEALELVAQARGAEIFDLVDTIAVIPGEGRNGKRMRQTLGLGIDQRCHDATSGLAIPALGLLEIKLETLKRLSAAEFAYTIIHELQHGLAAKREGQTLTIVKPVFGSLPEWQLDATSTPEDHQRRTAMVQSNWLWQTTDPAGEVTLTLANAIDERTFLKDHPQPEGTRVLRLGPPTAYGRTNWFEDQAETGTVAQIDSRRSADFTRVRSDQVDPLRIETLAKFFTEEPFDTYETAPETNDGTAVARIGDIPGFESHAMRDRFVVLTNGERSAQLATEKTRTLVSDLLQGGVPIDLRSRLHVRRTSVQDDPHLSELATEAKRYVYHSDAVDLVSLADLIKARKELSTTAERVARNRRLAAAGNAGSVDEAALALDTV